NMHIIAKTKKIGDYNVVVYIPIKYNYPYQNNELVNKFNESFKLNKNIEIVLNKPADKYAVFNKQNDYLFTLKLPDEPIYNENWAMASMFLFLAAFLILFYLYGSIPAFFGKTTLTSKEFAGVCLIMTVFVFICLKFNLPSTFFQNKILTPYHYASNSILASLTHLSVLTFFIFSTIYLYCYHVKKGVRKSKYFLLKEIGLLALPGVYFLLIFNFLIGLVFNSTTELNILKLADFTWVSIWNHFLLMICGIGYMLLHIRLHRELIRKTNLNNTLKIDIPVTVFFGIVIYYALNKYGMVAAVSFIILSTVLYIPHIFDVLMKTKWYITIWLFVFTLFVTWNSINMNRDKKFDKYKTLAENQYINDNPDEDKIAELMLNDLDKEIKNDQTVRLMMWSPDSIQKANEYLNNTYLRGFWTKYEMRLFTAQPGTELDRNYNETIETKGVQIKFTNFYVINNPVSDMAFLGAFKLQQKGKKNVNFYMEFYPRKFYRSYSFPDLLMETSPSLQVQLGLSAARYTYRQLAYTSGKFRYPRDGQWIAENKANFYVQDFGNYRHYIYSPNIYNYFILSEENTDNIWVYLLYVLYTFIAYLFICFFFIWIFTIIHKKTIISLNLTAKYLYTFVILLVASFISIFYVSINYMQQKYRDEQRVTLERTKNYIQTSLQEKYYWSERIDSSMVNTLNFNLQDLSYTYQTDIHVYDNRGVLLASSQPGIFSRGLISKQISPLPYFSKNPNMNKYEHIGDMEYLSAFTDFYNGDFLQIGYIAIPQYYSQDKVQSDIQNFLAVIVNIYLIIIILFIVLSLIISRQLSAPLTMLQDSLRDIRLGQRNKKIQYKPNDEIGQLVIQYNKTVDELEKSARLLAKSERESAWKTMARQVAHEINNPLTPMKLTIQQLQRTRSMGDERFDAYFEKSTATLIEQIENLSRIAGTFSNFARLPEAKPERVDVAKKINLEVGLFAHNHESVEITYQGVENGVFVMADSEQLNQVFNNLLKNALQSIPSDRDGIIQVKLTTTTNNVFITIIDNGKGIPDEIKNKLFNPNFTTKSTGMGLGLSISQNMIRIAGGEITFETKLNVGSEFKVTLQRIE
ncbi:MAG: integral rane sensor signal transduction histidine kinase, partial [Bacteroidetes bacterium]|nr:integral rane sensor signal transduction histidine kinase [Bacteroidota bacterium]